MAAEAFQEGCGARPVIGRGLIVPLEFAVPEMVRTVTYPGFAGCRWRNGAWATTTGPVQEQATPAWYKSAPVQPQVTGSQTFDS